MLILWLCNPEAALHAQLAADTDREWLEYQRQEDLDCEERLAREAVENDEVDSWPWYADAPIEVVDPEVIEDAQLASFPVDVMDEDADLDELPLDVAEDDYQD